MATLPNLTAPATADDSAAVPTTDWVRLQAYQAGTISETSITTTATLSSSAAGTAYVCSGTSADYTVTLPTAASIAGRTVRIRMSGALTKLVTVAAQSGQTVAGVASRVHWAGESLILMSDGSNWLRVGGVVIPMTCTIRLNANATVPDSAWTLVACNQTDIDNTGRMADITNNRITIVRAGNYNLLAVGAWLNLSAAATRLLTAAHKNNSQLTAYELSGVAGGYPTGALPLVAALAVNDLMTLKMLHIGTGTTQGIAGDTSATACQLIVTEQINW